ncbi:hypothetical protein NQZ68_005675 [Dissostichus eleginoides]|nr:hypothetical protein NQZ68_005675 [Dissostichus eleginoides]
MRHGNRISQQCSITNPFILSFGALWRPNASKRHPSQFTYGKQEEKERKRGIKTEEERDKDRGREGPRLWRVLSSGQRTMQSWQSRGLVPEGIECHMVPLMSRASLEGDEGHNALHMPTRCPPHANLMLHRWQYSDNNMPPVDLCLAQWADPLTVGTGRHGMEVEKPASHQPVSHQSPSPLPLSLFLSLLMPAGTLGAVPLQSLYPPPPHPSLPPPPLDASRRPSQCGTPSAAARPGNPTTPPLLANSTPPPLQTAATHNPPLPQPRGA